MGVALHWHPSPKARGDGKYPTHCKKWIVDPNNVTDDADKVIAADNGCERCQFTVGFPDYEPLPPHSVRMYAVASEVRELVSSARRGHRGTVRVTALEEIFRANNIPL